MDMAPKENPMHRFPTAVLAASLFGLAPNALSAAEPGTDAMVAHRAA